MGGFGTLRLMKCPLPDTKDDIGIPNRLPNIRYTLLTKWS